MKRLNPKPPHRPPAFASTEELQGGIDDYFNSLGTGKDKRFPTKGMLALWLDISRETMNEYSKQPHRFSDTIKRAYSRIEDGWVQNLGKSYPVGSIFYLKNAFKDNYRDSYDQTTNGKDIIAPVIVMYGAKDRLAQIMEKRNKNHVSQK